MIAPIKKSYKILNTKIGSVYCPVGMPNQLDQQSAGGNRYIYSKSATGLEFVHTDSVDSAIAAALSKRCPRDNLI